MTYNFRKRQAEILPNGLRLPENSTEPYKVQRSLKFKKYQIEAAKKYYTKEYSAWPKHLARRAMRNIKWFDYLWEYQQGESYGYLAWRYQITENSMKDHIKRARMRIETYLKIKEQQNENPPL